MAAGLINLILLVYLVKNKKKEVYIKQIILGIIQGLLYLPWIIYFSSQLKSMHDNGFWISLGPETIIQIGSLLFSGSLYAWIGFIISLFVYGYLIYLIRKEEKENIKPVRYALLVIVLLILASLIMSVILWSPILYYRYLTVVAGLMIFAISYMFAKSAKPCILYTFIAITILTTIPSNIIMISHNYDKSNNEPIDFIKNNIQENDVIVYPGIGTGAIMSAKFPQYKQYFYNAEDWGVEEAYKAFGPAMQTYTTDDFLNDEECQGRIWLVLDFYKVDYFNEKFNNENYRVLAKKQYFTKYNKEKAQNKETEYNIYLIEKINHKGERKNGSQIK